MKKLLFFLLLTTAVVGRAQTSLDLLPVGTEAPDFTITDSKTGKKIFQLSDKKTQKDKDGKTVPGVWTVLDFWASWCPDCRRDMPMVKAIYDKYNTKIQVVGVSFDTDEAKMKKYLGDNQYTWLQYCEFKKWKETKISKDYHISWIPTSYLINPEGKVAFSTVKAEEMMKKLDSLDQAGALKPAQVQTALKKVYNESIDPMAQIDEALAKARKNGKFVICQVGGNWCPWCLKFADFVEKNAAVNKMLNDHFEYIHVITAKPKAHAFKNEMCFPLTKTKCELKKHPNSKFECFFNDFNRTKTSLFLPFPSKLIQDNLVCVLELQE